MMEFILMNDVHYGRCLYIATWYEYKKMRLVMFWKNSFRFYEVSTSFPEKKNTFLLAKFIFAPSDVSSLEHTAQ